MVQYASLNADGLFCTYSWQVAARPEHFGSEEKVSPAQTPIPSQSSVRYRFRDGTIRTAECGIKDYLLILEETVDVTTRAGWEAGRGVSPA